MAVAEHLDFRFDLKQPLLRRRQKVTSREKVSGNGLRVATDEGAARMKGLAKEIVLLRRLRGRKAKLRRTPARFVVGRDRLISCTYNDVFVAAADSTKPVISCKC